MVKMKNKGFTLIELTITLFIFGTLLVLIYKVIFDLYEDKAIRAGASSSDLIIQNTAKILNSNYNDLILASNGSVTNGIKMNGMIPLNSVLGVNMNKYKTYSTQTPYLYITKCSNLSTTNQQLENCSFIPGHNNSGDLVSYIILPMSNSNTFNKIKNSLYISQKIGDFATTIMYNGSSFDIYNNKFGNNSNYKNFISQIMSNYPVNIQKDNKFVLIDMNQVQLFSGGAQNANNTAIEESGVGISRQTGTILNQASDGYLSMSYNFSAESGINNYIKFGSDSFLRVGRVFDANGHQIVLTNQVVRAPINLNSENLSDPNFIINVGGILYLNGQPTNKTQ